jgi:hypothetical protein
MSNSFNRALSEEFEKHAMKAARPLDFKWHQVLHFVHGNPGCEIGTDFQNSVVFQSGEEGHISE